MATPVLISNGENTLTSPSVGNPFSVGAALYVICNSFVSLGESKLDMFKSTDSGATWTLKDGAHSPLTDDSGAFAACIHGALIYGVYTNHAGAFWEVTAYNTATDTWGSASTSALQNFTTLEQQASVQFRPSDSLLVVLNNTSSTQATYFTFDTAALTFSSQVNIGDNTGTSCLPVDCFLGSASNQVWFVMLFLSGGTYQILFQLLTGSSLSSTSAVDSCASGNFTATGNASTDGTTVAFCWLPTTDGTWTVLTGALASLPTVTNQTVSLAGGHTGLFGSVSRASSGTTFVRSDTGIGSDNPVNYYVDSGSGFGSATVLDPNLQLKPFTLAASGIAGTDSSTGDDAYFISLAIAPPPPPSGSGQNYAHSG